MGMLSDEERAGLVPAELAANPTPVPTQVVSSDEFLLQVLMGTTT